MMETNENLYKIGAAASAAGIKVERLRQWERRHDFKPVRLPGSHRGPRYYTAAQVEQLKLISALLQRGERIRDVIHLSTTELRKALQDPLDGAVEDNIQSVLIGNELTNIYDPDDTIVQMLESFSNVGTFEATTEQLEELDAIVIFQPTLNVEELVSFTEQFSASLLASFVAVAPFATTSDLAEIQRTSIVHIDKLEWSVIRGTIISAVETKRRLRRTRQDARYELTESMLEELKSTSYHDDVFSINQILPIQAMLRSLDIHLQQKAHDHDPIHQSLANATGSARECFERGLVEMLSQLHSASAAKDKQELV